jgi:cytochrome P450
VEQSLNTGRGKTFSPEAERLPVFAEDILMECGSQRDNPAAVSVGKLAVPQFTGPLRLTPGPHGIVSFDQYVDPLIFLGGLRRDYGDVVRYTTAFGPCFFFVHPEHVQAIFHSENFPRSGLIKMMLGDGLLASDGPRWRSQRRLMQKDFLPAPVAAFAPTICPETERTCGEWLEAFKLCMEANVTNSMTRLTLRIIVKALFSEELSDAQATQLCDAVTRTINNLGKISWAIFGVPALMTPDTNATFAADRKVVDDTCYDMITRRRAQQPSDRPSDLLTLLLDAQSNAGTMTDLQIRDEMVTMLVGGHETTALALSWAWKAIAENPQIEQHLHDELRDVLSGRTPGLADVPKLAWTRSIFQEAMRLYPPVWYMARIATEPDVIGGHAIPHGACVLISAWFTHRHEAFWTSPETFEPSRFLDPAASPSHRYAYFPFGGGRHQCLGMHLALIEGTLILARLAQQFRVHPVAGQKIIPVPGITLRQSPLMRAFIEHRSSAASCTVSTERM